jgi:hypothetical protein
MPDPTANLLPVLLTLAAIALGIYVFWRAARIAGGLDRTADPDVPLFDSPGHPSETRFAMLEGVEDRNEDGRERQLLIGRCAVGQPLRLQRAPARWNAPERVLACLDDGTPLGWLPEAIGADVAASLQRGLRAEAVVADLRARAAVPFVRELYVKITRESNPGGAVARRGQPAIG